MQTGLTILAKSVWSHMRDLHLECYYDTVTSSSDFLVQTCGESGQNSSKLSLFQIPLDVMF